MPATYHIRIKKEYASAIIEDLQKMDALEIIPANTPYAGIPQWQIDAVRESKAYYQQHPEELMDWEDAKKLIKTD